MAKADLVEQLLRATRTHDLGEGILEEARERVRERLRRLRERVADEKLAEILAQLEGNLFKPDFSVSALKRTVKVTKKTLREFSRVTGLSPAAFVDELKTEEAFRLVLETDLKIWQIAEFAGLSHAYFTTKFRQRFAGKPSGVRKERRRQVSRVPGEPGATVPERGREASAGPASPAAVEAPQAPLIELLPAPAEAARRAAAAVWRSLAAVPYEVQRTRLRSYRFHTREFIDLLGKEYLIASRANRRRGVEVAELAVLSVETSAELLGELAEDLRALAYAWVANAKRLALDYDGAEGAMAKAEKVWAEPRGRRDQRAAGEILALKARLRFCQRQFDESVKLVNQAIKESRLAGASRLLAQCLLLRAAVMDYARMGKPTLPDLQQAHRVLRELNEPRLTLGIHISLAYSYTTAGQHQDALRHVAQAWALREGLREVDHDPLFPPQLRWNEGLARHGLGELAAAEGLYRKSREGFMALEESEHFAVVTLDLARLYGEQGRASEAFRFASEVLPVLEELKIPEAEAALDLLRDALEKSVLSTAILQSVRATLVRIQRAPLPRERPTPLDVMR